MTKSEVRDQSSEVSGKRPSYVATGFAGKCKIFPITDAMMLGYQQNWIKDNSIMKLMEKGRRIGVSYATAYERDSKHAQEDWNLDSWISSRDEPTSRLVIRDCKTFAKILHIGAQDLGLQVLDEKGGSGHVLRFANGTQINSVAGNPDVFAGKGGDVLLDEFALREDPRGVFTVAGPTIDWGGTLAIISTHRGSANYFNELVREINERGNPKRFSHHRVTLQDALDQGFLYKLQSKLRPGDERLEMDEAEYFNYQRSRAADEESFLQEYMCVPGDDAGAFLSYDLIARCEYSANQLNQFKIVREGKTIGTFDLFKDAKNPLYVGVDVGRVRDLTVIWVDEKIGDTNWTRLIIEMQNKTFDEQEASLYEVLGHPLMRRACIDNTGLGRQFAERAQTKFGQFKVEPVTFTGAVKEELAYPVRSGFEDRTERIPSDPLIRTDLRAIKKETTLSGNIRFTADAGPGGHADRFWAKALSKHAGKTAATHYAAVLV
jgi:phage FluMu gp28-like protein